MGFGKKKEGLILFAILLIFGFAFAVPQSGALNVITYDNGTFMIVNITDAVDLYAYEINFLDATAVSSVKFYDVLLAGGTTTKNWTLSGGITSVYESRLVNPSTGVNLSNNLTFNLTHEGSVILNEGIFVYANGTEETINFYVAPSCPVGQTLCSDGSCKTSCGGGGGTTCSDSWNCVWSSCVNGQKTKTCSYTGDCSTPSGKPADELQACTDCEQSWACSNWTECYKEMQERSCDVISNGCTISTNNPYSLTQSCVVNCTNDWSCAWGTCIDDQQSASNCVDTNKCEIQLNKPVSRSCNSTCPNPQVVCGKWSSCSTSYSIGGIFSSEQTRNCHDNSGCLSDSTETMKCSPNTEVNSTIRRDGDNLILELFDLEGNLIGSILTTESGGKIGFDINLFSSKISLSSEDYFTIDYTWFDILLFGLLILLVLTFILLLLKKYARAIKRAWKIIGEKYNMQKLRELYAQFIHHMRSHHREKRKHEPPQKREVYHHKPHPVSPESSEYEISKRNQRIRDFFTLKNYFNKRK